MNNLGKWTIPAILLVAVLFLAMLIGGSYNGLVASRETVNKATGDLQSAYQRRNDLIPNLVNTVKGSSTFEQDTLTAVVDARSRATQTTLPANATPEQLKAFQEAQSNVSSSLSRLLAVVENYPDIKSTAAYQDLMNQLEGTENRINVARQRYNQAVEAFNGAIRAFPESLTNSLLLHLDRKEYFKAAPEAREVPKVDFQAK